MLFSKMSCPRRIVALVAIAMGSLPLFGELSDAQQLTQPVYRVATPPAQTSAAAPARQAPVQQAVNQQAALQQPFARLASTGGDSLRFDDQVQLAAATTPVPFDLEQRAGEHPLMPCLRLATGALADIDRTIQDYSATFTKVERLNGTLSDPQKMELRVRHQPFSVYMRFITPNPGQEALYVENQNNGKLVAMGSGWKRRVGKLNLDPTGAMAMRGQRYPITKAGIRNLTTELIEIAESDVKYAECEVKHSGSRVDGRPATMIQAVHPVPRKNFKFHKAQIFIDNEWRLPVAYRAYSWPTTAGGPPVLEEQYIYTNLKINNGFTDQDFSAENPAMFQ